MREMEEVEGDCGQAESNIRGKRSSRRVCWRISQHESVRGRGGERQESEVFNHVEPQIY